MKNNAFYLTLFFFISGEPKMDAGDDIFYKIV